MQPDRIDPRGSVMTRTVRTSAPRSSVIHGVNVDRYRATVCGRTIGDNWAGEYTAEPSGPITCARCLTGIKPSDNAHAETHRPGTDCTETRYGVCTDCGHNFGDYVTPCNDCGGSQRWDDGSICQTCQPRKSRDGVTLSAGMVVYVDGHTRAEVTSTVHPDRGVVLVTVDGTDYPVSYHGTHLFASLAFTPGQYVGILVGLQAVGGPTVGQYGTVIRAEEFWHGVTEYIVRHEDGTELVYRPYLLVDATDRIVSRAFERRGFRVRRAELSTHDSGLWIVMAYRQLPGRDLHGFDHYEYVIATIRPGDNEWNAGTYVRTADAADQAYRARR